MATHNKGGSVTAVLYARENIRFVPETREPPRHPQAKTPVGFLPASACRWRFSRPAPILRRTLRESIPSRHEMPDGSPCREPAPLPPLLTARREYSRVAAKKLPGHRAALSPTQVRNNALHR